MFKLICGLIFVLSTALSCSIFGLIGSKGLLMIFLLCLFSLLIARLEIRLTRKKNFDKFGQDMTEWTDETPIDHMVEKSGQGTPVWMDDPPTEPNGFWLSKYRGFIHLVEIRKDGDGKLWAHYDGSKTSLELLERENAEWCAISFL